MTAVPVKNIRGDVVGSVELDDRVFGIEPNRAVVHQAVVAQLANQRKGTHETKTRGEVRGGTHKMWRQKGTGRARQGDRRAPHWKGGGVVFGPHPRSYHQDLPRKMRRLAMCSALSARAADDTLIVLDELVLPAAKTREMRAVMQALGVDRSALIVVPEKDEAVYRAASNLDNVRTVTPGGLNLIDVLKFRNLILTRGAAEVLVLKLTTPIVRGSSKRSADGAGQEPSVVMDETATSERDAGTPGDVAVADGAERALDRVTAEGPSTGSGGTSGASGSGALGGQPSGTDRPAGAGQAAGADQSMADQSTREGA
jgi:large subunit ribosomal protein L4